MDRATMIAQLKTRRSDKRDALDAILADAKRSNAMTSGQRTMFDSHESEIRTLDDRIDELESAQRMDDAAAETARKYAPAASAETRNSRMTVVNEPGPYRPDGNHSWFGDMYAARSGDYAAADRLRRSSESRGVTTGAGSGSAFVPPKYLVDQWIQLARPGRPTADLLAPMPMPTGTNQVSIPKIATGSSVASQATELTGISQTDITTSSVTAPVVTLAGQQIVSVQELQMSPGAIDQVVMSDLAAQYGQVLDSQVINGAGTGNTLKGLLNQTGITSLTWTAATPAVTGANGLWGNLANLISQLHSARYAPPTAIIVHPRRWAWIAAATDSQFRPLVNPEASGVNVYGTNGAIASEGYVGKIMGVPVYTDASIPTNLGAGTNQDAIIVLRASDVMLWEGVAGGTEPRIEAFEQPFAGSLGVLFRVYSFAAMASRYPASIGVITGTGLVAPSF
ncbi:phage major capsid protein [Streptomyces mirabilis]|uniref:phage major capsid protein n=1 Tax=Streptomyces mirabilis TaxID=68239 RepID=UPI00225343DE|nr:phage major capsid protein [Streptomyces mirabilis]MCX5349180.1 phage major capsid protein [Streptomyces mirabilis]